MPGPWEQYQTAPKAAPTAPKPWEQYQAAAPAPAGEKTWEQSASDAIRNVGGFLLKPIVAVGRKVDSISGAPTRAAIGAIQAGESPLKAFAKQFGEDPELAPTGKEIASKAGVSTDEYRVPFIIPDKDGFRRAKVSPAEAVGVGVDLLADPLNVVGPTAFAKLGGKAAATGAGKMAMAGIKGGSKAIDVVTGTEAASKLVGAAGETAKAAKLALNSLFNPKRADDYADLARIAERNGVPVADLPEAVEFGPDSVITRASRVRAEGPLGQGDLEKFRAVSEKTKRATENRIAKIAGGRILRPEEAGSLIREGYDQAVERLMAGARDTYASIAKSKPGLRLNGAEAEKLFGVMDEMDAFAQKRMALGVTRAQKAQAKQLKDTVDTMLGIFDGRSARLGAPMMSDAVDVLKNLGEAAYKKRMGLDLDPPDIRRLQQLYGSMRDAIVNTVEKDISSDIATKLRKNNATISKFLDDRSPLERALSDKTMSDENLFRNLVEHGDTLKTEALRQFLTPDQMQQVKGSFLDGLLQKDLDADFSFARTTNRIRNKQTQFESLLTPEEIKEFADVIRLGDRFGTPIMSTSGTGASSVFKDITQGVKNSLANDSFIKTLKNRARGESPKSGAKKIPTAFGDMELMPDPKTRFQGAVMGLRGRSGLDKRLKGSQVLSLQPLDENEQRREAIRRRMMQLQN